MTAPLPGELEEYRAAGMTLMPLPPQRKSPPPAGWRTADFRTEDAVDHCRRGGNVAVRLRGEDLVIDVDPRNFGDHPDPPETLAKDFDFDWGSFPSVITGRRDGGMHFYLRKPPDVRILDTVPDEAYPGIEFKSIGRYVVAAGGIHPDTGEHYLWSELRPNLAGRPEVPERLISLLRRPQRTVAVGGGEMSADRLAACLALLPITEFREHDRWFRIMAAAHHGTGGEGREEFVKWSTGDPWYAEDAWTIGARWDSLHADKEEGKTVQSIFREILDRGLEVPGTDPSEDFGPVGDREEPTPLERMNALHACVRYGGSFTVMTRESDPTLKCSFWSRGSEESLRKWYRNAPFSKGKTIADWWLEHPKRRQYWGVVFDPEQDHPDRLNLWTGWAISPRVGRWDRFRELIIDRLCRGDEGHADYVLRWCAHMFQRPWIVPEVALVFRSEERGTGKGTFSRALLRIAGNHGMPVSNQKHVTGQYTDHFLDKVLVSVEEAFWAGDRSGEAALKELLSEPVRSHEGKYAPVVKARNFLHAVINANVAWVVPAGLVSERRFAVFDVDPTWEGRKAKWDAVNAELDGGGLAAFLYDMLRVDLTGWHPRDGVPQTEALMDQKRESMDFVDRWWLETLEEGRLPGVGAWDGPCEAFTQELVADLSRHMQEAGARYRVDLARKLGRRLVKLCPAAARVRRRPGSTDGILRVGADGRAWGYSLPGLAAAREMFTTVTGVVPLSHEGESPYAPNGTDSEDSTENRLDSHPLFT